MGGEGQTDGVAVGVACIATEEIQTVEIKNADITGTGSAHVPKGHYISGIKAGGMDGPSQCSIQLFEI